MPSDPENPTLAQAMQTFASMLCVVEALNEKVDRVSEKLELLCQQRTNASAAPPAGSKEKEFYTVRETAAIIGTSEKSVRRLQKRGFFKSSNALRTKQIPRSEIERYKKETV